jgi:hypothetical protein
VGGVGDLDAGAARFAVAGFVPASVHAHWFS